MEMWAPRMERNSQVLSLPHGENDGKRYHGGSLLFQTNTKQVDEYHRKDPYKVGPPSWLSWFVTPITMVYGTQITIVTGGYKPTNITEGGPHCTNWNNIAKSPAILVPLETK